MTRNFIISFKPFFQAATSLTHFSNLWKFELFWTFVIKVFFHFLWYQSFFYFFLFFFYYQNFLIAAFSWVTKILLFNTLLTFFSGIQVTKNRLKMSLSDCYQFKWNFAMLFVLLKSQFSWRKKTFYKQSSDLKKFYVFGSAMSKKNGLKNHQKKNRVLGCFQAQFNLSNNFKMNISSKLLSNIEIEIFSKMKWNKMKWG